MSLITRYILGLLLGIVLLFGVLGSSHASCSQTCSIASASDPVLTEYVTNAETLMQNILSGLESEGNSNNNSQEDVKKSLLPALKNNLSFGEHFGSFDFFVSSHMTQEIPSQVDRDYKRIENISEKSELLLKKVTQRGQSSLALTNICDGILECPYQGKELGEILTSMSVNNTNISRLFMGSVIGKELSTNYDFDLVSTDFTPSILENYNTLTLSACSQCEGESGKKYSEVISRITDLQNDYKKGMNSWKQAWVLLRGGKDNTASKSREQELMREYLAGQNTHLDQNDIVLDNINRYNAGGLDASNPLNNTLRYSQLNIREEAKSFEESILEKLESQETVGYAEITRTDLKEQQTSDIQNQLSTLYNDLKPLALSQDTQVLTLQGRILKMHFSLVRSINLLDRYTGKAEKVCDKQGTGLGKCRDY